MIERFGTHGTGPGGNPLPFAKAVRAGDFVFVSGQVGAGPDGEIVAGGIVEQTTRCIENIKGILELAGVGLEHVVKTTVWLDDLRDFWSMNRVYAGYFGEHLPTRSCVQARLVVDCKIEIEVTAYAPKV